MPEPTTRRAIAAILVAMAAPLGGGCGDGDRPKDASPIVSPDSEAGKKALAESEQLLKLRKEQEAKARKASRKPHVEVEADQ